MSTTLTPAEHKLLLVAVQCMDLPKPDFEKMAEIGGYTKGSASVMWGTLKRKLLAGGLTTGTPTATPTSKKRAIGVSGEEEGTPSKKAKKGGKGKKGQVQVHEDGDDEESGGKLGGGEEDVVKKEEDGDGVSEW